MLCMLTGIMQIIHALHCTFVLTVHGTKYEVLARKWGGVGGCHCMLLVYTQPSCRQHLSAGNSNYSTAAVASAANSLAKQQ